MGAAAAIISIQLLRLLFPSPRCAEHTALLCDCASELKHAHTDAQICMLEYTRLSAHLSIYERVNLGMRKPTLSRMCFYTHTQSHTGQHSCVLILGYQVWPSCLICLLERPVTF